MIESIDGLSIFYQRFEGEGTPVLLLHGWGCDSKIFDGLYSYISQQNRSVLSIDFPHFGQSQTPPDTFTVYDYAAVVQKLLHILKIDSVIIVGHSFGGRVGIILAANDIFVKKLVLIDSAGIRPRRSIKRGIRVLVYKIKKRLKLQSKNAGSADYRALDEGMRKVFVRIVNTHLHSEAKKIKAPTLIIWGQNDTDTPLYMARKLNKLIDESGLVVLQNAAHFSFLTRHNDVCQILNAFI